MLCEICGGPPEADDLMVESYDRNGHAHDDCLRAANRRARIASSVAAERSDSQWLREIERRRQILTAMNTEETA